MGYNKTLLQLQIRDHQVENASLPRSKLIGLILYRLGKLVILSIAVLPGLTLFAPVFIVGKLVSIKKSKEALAASSVKIHANDVMATWKLLVSLVLAPVLYIFYDIILGIVCYKNRVYGLAPTWMPIWLVVVIGFIIFGSITYAALRFGEIGMDIAKSLRPLFIALSPQHGNTIQNLRWRREQLAVEVTELINELGPEMFPDFEKKRIVPDTLHRRDDSRSNDDLDDSSSAPPTPSSSGNMYFGQNHLPRNESLHDLSSIGVFASRPASRPQTPRRNRSRSKSRSGSGSFGDGLHTFGFSPLEASGADVLNTQLRSAMTRRSKHKQTDSGGWESDSSSASGGPMDGLTMTKRRE
jgi:glycerol-3-phosphate O-acyltransferase / dihydroxyacetone phosphate acyltransferase